RLTRKTCRRIGDTRERAGRPVARSQSVRQTPLQWEIVALVKALNVVAIETFVTDLHPGAQRAHGRKFLDGEPDRLRCRRKAAILQRLSGSALALSHEQLGGGAAVGCSGAALYTAPPPGSRARFTRSPRTCPSFSYANRVPVELCRPMHHRPCASRCSIRPDSRSSRSLRRSAKSCSRRRIKSCQTDMRKYFHRR